MLRVYATKYVKIGQMYEQYVNSALAALSDPTALPTDIEFEHLLKALRDIKDYCSGTWLRVSAQNLKITVDEYVNMNRYGQRPTLGLSRQRLSEWFRCFSAELDSTLFLLVPPERVAYWSSESEMGSDMFHFAEVLGLKFPTALYDASEAGKCFAFGCFTACVHHLSRVVELGLVSVASYAGVDAKDQKNWNTALNQAHANLRDKKGNFQNVAARSADEIYYSEAIGLLRNFNTAWRNPSSHAPTIFEEPKARSLFSIAAATMVHICQRHKEVPMPGELA